MNNSTHNTTAFPEVMKCSLGYQSMTQTDIEILYEVSVGTSTVNCLTSFTAVVANALVIAAILRQSSLHPPSNSLLCCLAVTDFLTGLIAQPLFVISHIARVKGNTELYCATTLGFSVSVAVLAIVSFLTLTAISVDRFLSLHLHLRYRALVTNRRIIGTAFCCWVLCMLEVSLTVPSGHYILHFGFLVTFLAVGIFVSLLAYYRIFSVIRSHEIRIRAEEQLALRLQADTGKDIDIRKHKKASWTMAYVSAVFLLCYVPYISVLIANVIIIPQTSNLVDLKIAGNVSLSIVLGNASVSPFLYCYRTEGIKRAVIAIVKDLIPCLRRNTPIFRHLPLRNANSSFTKTNSGNS